MTANVALTDTFDQWRVKTNEIVVMTQSDGMSNIIKTIDTTNSTSNTTGSIITTGGVGIAKSVVIGENLRVHGNTIIDGDTTISGNLVFGSADTDQVSFSADINSNMVPNANLTFNLGNTTLYWANTWTGHLTAEQKSDSGKPALTVSSLDVDQIAVDVNASQTTGNVLDITADAVTTGTVLNVTADLLTTGPALYIDSNSAETDARSVAKIINNNALAVGATALALQADAGRGLFIETTLAAGGYSLEIDATQATTNTAKIASATTTGTVLDMQAESITTGRGVNYFDDSLTTGSALYIDSDSASTGTRNLVSIINNNALATAANALYVKNDSTNTVAQFIGQSTIVIPAGTTAQRGNANQGGIRYNTTLSAFEGYSGSTWGSLGGLIDVDQDTYVLAETSAGTDNDDLDFFTAGTQRMKIDETGVTTLGPGFATKETIAGAVSILQVEAMTTEASASIWKNSADAVGPTLVLGKSRGTAVNADTIVVDDDVLGSILFSAADGVDRASVSACIQALVGGTPGADDTPGELLFKTTADGAQSPTERMRIMSNGDVGIGISPVTKVHISGTDAIVIPVGTTAQRGTATAGGIRYNSTTSQFEGYSGSTWGSLGGLIDVDQDTKIIAETSAGADNDSLDFYTAGTQRMQINSVGHIGIATTSPSIIANENWGDVELQVKGTYEDAYFVGLEDAAGHILTEETTGDSLLFDQAFAPTYFTLEAEDGQVLEEDGTTNTASSTGNQMLQEDSIGFGKAVVAIVGADEASLVLSDESAAADDKAFVVQSKGGEFRIDDYADNGTLLANRFLINSAGLVGIGTNAPLTGIHFVSADPFLTISDSSDNQSVSSAIQFLENGAQPWATTGNNGFRWMLDGSANKMHFQSTAGSTTLDNIIVVERDSGKIGIGTVTPNAALTVEGTITLKEQAAAAADTAAYGQIWVDDAVPCALYFTNDAGNDIQITSGTAMAGGISGWGVTSTHFLPDANNTQNIGSTSYKVANLYTTNLYLGDAIFDNTDHEVGNIVDGTQGKWRVQEGANDLFVINELTGTKYKMALVEA